MQQWRQPTLQGSLVSFPLPVCHDIPFAQIPDCGTIKKWFDHRNCSSAGSFFFPVVVVVVFLLFFFFICLGNVQWSKDGPGRLLYCCTGPLCIPGNKAYYILLFMTVNKIRIEEITGKHNFAYIWGKREESGGTKREVKKKIITTSLPAITFRHVRKQWKLIHLIKKKWGNVTSSGSLTSAELKSQRGHEIQTRLERLLQKSDGGN